MRIADLPLLRTLGARNTRGVLPNLLRAGFMSASIGKAEFYFALNFPLVFAGGIFVDGNKKVFAGLFQKAARVQRRAASGRDRNRGISPEDAEQAYSG